MFHNKLAFFGFLPLLYQIVLHTTNNHFWLRIFMIYTAYFKVHPVYFYNMILSIFVDQMVSCYIQLILFIFLLDLLEVHIQLITQAVVIFHL